MKKKNNNTFVIQVCHHVVRKGTVSFELPIRVMCFRTKNVSLLQQRQQKDIENKENNYSKTNKQQLNKNIATPSPPKDQFFY